MSVTLEELIQRAGVDHGFVRRLHELGAFGSDDDRYEERDVHVAALLRMWERAGLSIPSILAAVEAGRLSLDFLDAPAWELPEPLPITYREFADEQGIPFELLQGIQAAMGFAAPDPDDRVARSSGDGDVYGRTVNIASRIADEAEAGEVLTSQETTEETEDASVRFERSRTAHLKGVAKPMTLYRAFRGS